MIDLSNGNNVKGETNAPRQQTKVDLIIIAEVYDGLRSKVDLLFC